MGFPVQVTPVGISVSHTMLTPERPSYYSCIVHLLHPARPIQAHTKANIAEEGFSLSDYCGTVGTRIRTGTVGTVGTYLRYRRYLRSLPLRYDFPLRYDLTI